MVQKHPAAQDAVPLRVIARNGEQPERRPLMGIAVWLTCHDEVGRDRLLDFVRRGAVEGVRLGISWAECHKEGGLEWYGALLAELAARTEVVPCFHYTPPSLGVVASTNAPPREPKAFADFIDVFTTAYGRHFTTAELWNEPNNLLDYDFRLDPDWLSFRTMIGGAAYWLRQLGKRTVLAGLCPTDAPLVDFMREHGVLDHIDIMSIHAFPGTWTSPWNGWEAEIAPMREVAARCATPPAIWITETGYSTWRQDEGRQLQRFAEAAEEDVERVYWYALSDLAPEEASQEGLHFDDRHYHCGILRADGSPKLLGRLLLEGGPSRAIEAARRFRPRPRRSAARPIVVTGGAGFIGANLVDRLAASGRDVLVYDSLERPGATRNVDWLQQRHGDRVELAVADIRDKAALTEAVTGAAGVFHLAGQVAVTTSVVDPESDFEINARGTFNLLEAARRQPSPPPILFASTNKVYGKLMGAEELELVQAGYRPLDQARRAGCDERTPLDLYSPYGCSKGAADQYVLDYARIYGLQTIVLRMSCIYGPRQFGHEDQGWVAHFLRAALAGQPITIFGDGHQVRDVLFIDDAIDAYLTCFERAPVLAGRAFNLGGGPRRCLSLATLLGLMRDRLGLRPAVNYAGWRPGDQLWYVSDTRALETATGWRAGVDIEQGLSRLFAWLQTLEAHPVHEHAASTS